MKHPSIKNKSEQDAFTDLLFNALLGFALMFAVAFMLMSTPEEKGKIEMVSVGCSHNPQRANKTSLLYSATDSLDSLDFVDFVGDRDVIKFYYFLVELLIDNVS